MVFLHREGFLENFWPKQGQDLSSTPLASNGKFVLSLLSSVTFYSLSHCLSTLSAKFYKAALKL